MSKGGSSSACKFGTSIECGKDEDSYIGGTIISSSSNCSTCNTSWKLTLISKDEGTSAEEEWFIYLGRKYLRGSLLLSSVRCWYPD